MKPVLQSSLWFAAGLAVSALVLSVAHGNPATDAAPPAARLHAAALRGAVSADVVRVIDGDTFEADAKIWLGQSVDVHVRIAGIDAPEIHARCASELAKAEEARAYLAGRIANNSVWLSDVTYDKYGGRVRASVSDDSGDIARDMIAKGLARPYHGERRLSWCNG